MKPRVSLPEQLEEENLDETSYFTFTWKLASTRYFIHFFTQSLSFFATHAHTIATYFAVVPRLCHLILVSLNSTHTHTHAPFYGPLGFCPRLVVCQHQKGKTNLDLLEQEIP